jgi:hypothetical protein
MVDELKHVVSPALTRIYSLIEEILASDLQAASGTKSARTRLRVQLSELGKLTKTARKEIPANTAKPKKEE